MNCEDILKDDAICLILEKMRALCSVREYCSSEIYEKVLRMLYKPRGGKKGEDEDEEQVEISAAKGRKKAVAEAIVEKLKEEDFLSDERYAMAYVRDKAYLYAWGPQKIKYGLIGKGIDSALVVRAIHNIDVSVSTNQLERMIFKKYLSLTESKKGHEDVRNKLIRFALGRGYLMDDVLRCVDKILK